MHLSSSIAVMPNVCMTNVKQTSCCQGSSKVSPWLKRIDRICRIAIGIFAVWMAPIPFSIALGVGILAGGGYALACHLKNKPMFPSGDSKPVCAQGYMDFLSGMRFPPEIGTLATAAFIGAHMRHDPQFYAPFCGLFLGLWIGREGFGVAKNLGGRSIGVIHRLL